MRDFDAEVAARDHECVGETDDVLDMVEGGRLLDLRHEPGAGRRSSAARLDHVAWLLHEGQGDPVDAEFEPESKVGAVLCGQRREIEHRAGKVDALAVGDRAADDDLGVDEVVAEAGYPDPHPAVVDQEMVARRDGGEDLRVGQGDRRPVAARLPSSTKRIVSPASTLIVPSLIVADADLGTLEIQKDADGTTDLALQRPNGGVDAGVILMGAVAEIQPKGVDSGVERASSASRARHLPALPWRRSWLGGIGA